MLSRDVIIKAIEAHEAAGCRFALEYPGANGCAYARLTPEGIAEAILESINLAARISGLTPEEYREWLELNGRVRCAAQTARKQQCRNAVSGPLYANPLDWKKQRAAGQYCSTHGGE